MNEKKFFALALLLGVGLVWAWGCQSSHPAAPARFMSVNVKVPVPNSLRSSLLGASSNELLYKVTGPGMTAVRGKAGPFNSSTDTQMVDFSLSVPAGPSRVLAVQLNDASSHSPLAVGAVGLDLSGGVTNANLTVELGSVVRSCYAMNWAVTICLSPSYMFGFANYYTQSYYPYSYGSSIDISAVDTGTGFMFVDSQGNTGGPVYANSIAFMGNGDLVDFAYVPNADAFASDSSISKQYVSTHNPPGGPSNGGHENPTPTPGGELTNIDIKASMLTYQLQAGDVYCIAPGTIPGGHAWVQVTDPGVPSVSGPSFRFRTNSKLPYYGYEQTQADLDAAAYNSGICQAGGC